MNKAKPVDPAAVERYLEGKFGETLPAARAAMSALAKAFKPDQLANEAFRLYEEFRPGIPEGVTFPSQDSQVHSACCRVVAVRVRRTTRIEPGFAGIG